MYQDPDTINRHPATESGQLYSGGANEEGLLAEEASRGTKTEEELAEMFSTPDKSRQREVGQGAGPGREGERCTCGQGSGWWGGEQCMFR